MNRTGRDQQGEDRGSEPTILSDILDMYFCHLAEAVRWEEGEKIFFFFFSRSFAGVKRQEKKRTGVGGWFEGSGREGGSCQWSRAVRGTVQWRDTHPRGEDIFEVQLHQSTLPFILIFNLLLSPPVINPCVYSYPPLLKEESDWHTRSSYCRPPAARKLYA